MHVYVTIIIIEVIITFLWHF